MQLKSKDKVLLVSPLPPPAGGIASWTISYLNSEIRKNYSIDHLNNAVIGKRVLDLKNGNISDEIKRNVKYFKNLFLKLLKNKYTIIHLNTSCSKIGLYRDLITVVCSKIFRVKIIIHCHCDVEKMIKKDSSKKIFSFITNLSDKIIVLNKSSESFINSTFNQKTILIPNFIEDEINNVKLKNYINKDIKEVLYVGHVTNLKGCKEIIEAAKSLPNIQFKLYGNINESFKTINLPKNLTLFGEVRKKVIYEEMIMADVFLLPSHTEGFPLAVLEAMAFGLPIIATNVGAVPEMIEDNGGILINVGNPKEIIEAILKLENPKLREKMSNWNISKVENNYTLSNVIGSLEEVYKEL